MRLSFYGAVLSALLTSHLAGAGESYYDARYLKSVDQVKLAGEIKDGLSLWEKEVPGIENFVKTTVDAKYRYADCLVKRLEIAKRLVRYVNREKARQPQPEGLLFARSGARELKQFAGYFREEKKRYEFSLQAPPPRIFKLKDFGAKGDGIHDDNQAFLDAIAAIRKLNGAPAVLKVPQGTYLMNSPRKYHKIWPKMPIPIPGLEREKAETRSFLIHLPLLEMRNLTIEGEPGTLLLFGNSGWSEGIGIYNCENVTLRNLEIDYKNLPFSQGKIVSVNPQKQQIVWQKEAGYPDPSIPQFDCRPNGGPGLTVYNDDQTRSQFKRSAKHGIRHLKDNMFKIQLVDDRGKTMSDLRPGRLLAVRARYNGISSAIFARYNKFTTYDHVIIYTSPFSGIQSQMNYADAYFNVKIIPRPGTTRVMSTVGDAVPQDCPFWGAYFANCVIDGAQDDILITTTRAVPISKIYRDRVRSLTWLPFFPGSAMRVLDPNSAKVIYETQCKAKLPYHDYIYDPPLPDYVVGSESLHDRNFNQEGDLMTFVNAEKTVRLPDRLLCVERSGIGLIVTNCKFSRSPGNACDIETPDAIIENSRINDLNCFGIAVVSRNVYSTASTPHNVIVRNNNVANCGSPLWIAYNHEHGGNDFVVIRDVLVENNVFAGPRWNYPYFIMSAADITLKNNLFIANKAYPKPKIKNSYNIIDEGNKTEFEQ